jgi:hypothetical protein
MADFTIKETNKITGSTRINQADDLIQNTLNDLKHWANSTNGTLEGGQDWSSGGLVVSSIDGEFNSDDGLIANAYDSLSATVYADGSYGSQSPIGAVGKGTTYGMVAEGLNNSTAGLYGKVTSGTGIGVIGEQDGTTWTPDNAGVKGITDVTNGIGVFGLAPLSGTCTGVYGEGEYAVVGGNQGLFGFWTAGNCWFENSAYPFTGAHISLTQEEPEVGDIIIATDAFTLTINNSIPYAETVSTAKDKRVVGVCNKGNQDFMKMALKSETLGEALLDSDGKEIGRKIKDQYKDEIDNIIVSGYKMGSVNALGEGAINVCSENGNIEAGDYICSSNTRGKGMKQDDDILHSYTVAKALESVNWDEESDSVKMIACTYHCG